MSPQQAPIQLRVNGRPHQVAAGTTLQQLLQQLQVPLRYVAVEVNEAVIPREEYHRYELQPGDQVEVVTLVGGG